MIFFKKRKEPMPLAALSDAELQARYDLYLKRAEAWPLGSVENVAYGRIVGMLGGEIVRRRDEEVRQLTEQLRRDLR